MSQDALVLAPIAKVERVVVGEAAAGDLLLVRANQRDCQVHSAAVGVVVAVEGVRTSSLSPLGMK